MLKLFHITRQVWDALPWHDQRMYIEQLNMDPEYHEDGDTDTAGAVELTSWDDLPPGA